MNEPEHHAISLRVAAIRQRHWVIALVAAVAGSAAFALPAREAPLTAQLFLFACGLGVAGWQLWLGRQIGRGLSALRAGRTVVWVYALHASINGAHVASGVILGLDAGERFELPLAFGVDPKDTIAAIARAHPRATIGFDAATEARFHADPRSLLRPA